ncbi:hypothetical protein POSPLADRAFT_1044859 [Postia placenta MAD-698-R-SB12]|uniref:Uncharacterized protein n=1 Tax=Postia placenta MAD-698-R-SB12 TaxID=670580 RepID=A0A1X6NA32_9APHY|nr:hypothetical protein POSPLADRAFT_1044859 [Postia placenta MAD-698-R-SB12]OSX65507.1 hypothetical protein POSPLADRAFT_1044859 [Postia placenta MAD-698-R-SB12]
MSQEIMEVRVCAGSAMRSQAPSVRRAQSTGHASWPGHGVRAPAFRPPGGRLLRSEPESLGLRRPFSDVTAGTGWGVRSVARGAGAGGRCTLTYLHEDGGVRERRRLGVCAPGFSAAPAPSSAAGRARTGALRAFSAAAALADVHVTHGREHAEGNLQLLAVGPPTENHHDGSDPCGALGRVGHAIVRVAVAAGIHVERSGGREGGVERHNGCGEGEYWHRRGRADTVRARTQRTRGAEGGCSEHKRRGREEHYKIWRCAKDGGQRPGASLAGQESCLLSAQSLPSDGCQTGPTAHTKSNGCFYCTLADIASPPLVRDRRRGLDTAVGP